MMYWESHKPVSHDCDAAVRAEIAQLDGSGPGAVLIGVDEVGGVEHLSRDCPCSAHARVWWYLAPHLIVHSDQESVQKWGQKKQTAVLIDSSRFQLSMGNTWNDP